VYRGGVAGTAATADRLRENGRRMRRAQRRAAGDDLAVIVHFGTGENRAAVGDTHLPAVATAATGAADADGKRRAGIGAGLAGTAAVQQPDLSAALQQVIDIHGAGARGGRRRDGRRQMIPQPAQQAAAGIAATAANALRDDAGGMQAVG